MQNVVNLSPSVRRTLWGRQPKHFLKGICGRCRKSEWFLLAWGWGWG